LKKELWRDLVPADDFAAIRARMEELERERAQGARGAEPVVEADRYPHSRSSRPVGNPDHLRALLERHGLLKTKVGGTAGK